MTARKLDLNHWLRKTPQPVAVLADDKRIEVGKGGRAWRDLTRTVEALGPAKVTCLDNNGSVLRVTVMENVASADDDEVPAKTGDSEIETFARLIADAYAKASSASQPLITNAFSFVERLSDSLAKAQIEIEKLRERNARLVLQINELSLQEPESEGGVMAALVQGMATAGQHVQAVPPQTKAVKR